MAANVQSMFYVGNEAPWHGLGTSVESAPTSADALRLAGLNWDVIPVPSVAIITPNMVKVNPSLAPFINKRIPTGLTAHIRSDNGALLGNVGKRYNIFQNTEAFSFIDEIIGEGVTFETAGSLGAGERNFLLARMPKQEILGDEFIPYCVLSNCHDGTNAVKVALTPVRVVCQNTLNQALNSADRVWSARHNGTLANKVETAKETLFNTEKYMQAFRKSAEEQAIVTVSPIEFEKFVNAVFKVRSDKDGAIKERDEMKRDGFIKVYNSDDNSNFKGTVYGINQAIFDFFPHAAPDRNTETARENKFMAISDGTDKQIITASNVLLDMFGDRLTTLKSA